MKAREITTKFGETIKVNSSTVCVTMNDKELGQWEINGYRPHKQIYICENKAQALTLVDRLANPKYNMNYVKMRVGVPYFSPLKYTVSYDKYDDNIFTY